MSLLTISCPCLFGLESVLSGEVKRMGGENVQVTDGKVTFQGDETMVAKANICLRTAERVLIQLGSFQARTFTELFDQTVQLPFEAFIGRTDAFPVKGWSLGSQLHSIPDCQSIIKKAAVRRMEQVYHQSWFEETGPVHQIQFSIHKDNVCIFLDTSGVGLHKRGYRKTSNAAPIKETLAAGIIDLARVRQDDVVYDPFCGSGTFLVESAFHALNIAPGMRRRFAAEQWDCFSKEIWTSQRKEANARIRRDGKFRAFGYDIDPEAVALSQENAYQAGVAGRVKTSCQGIDRFQIEDERAIIFANPPYGERMLEIQQAEEIYRTMGRVFQQRKYLSFYIISPHENFEEIFGRPADKRRKLYNGMIKCQLYMYFRSK